MPAHKNLKFILITTVLLALVAYIPKIAFGGCSDIQDLDDRAKCYEEKIEDKKEDYESTSKQLEDIRNKKDSVSQTISKYLSELSVTQGQIDELQAEINSIKEDLDYIKENLTDRKTKLSEKIDFRNKVVRNYSKRSFKTDLEMFFSAKPLDMDLNGFQYSSLTYMFNKSLTEEALRLIYLLNSEIDTFEKDKAETETLLGELQVTQNSLLSLKADIDAKKASAQSEFGSLSSKEGEYEGELQEIEREIQELTAKQQAILQAKFDSAPVPLLASTSLGGCSSDIGKSPGFSGKRIGFFSYGVPNKVGLNQYGARGRAEKDNQDYKKILNSYYKEFKLTDDYNTDVTITINGKNPYGQVFNNEKMDLEEYMEHLYEMPSGWHKEALKAQAVAARTYALYITNNGTRSIIPSEEHQVVKKEKNAKEWRDAVKATEGEVMLYDGSPIGAWYSSTHGGVVLKSGQIGWNDKPWTKHDIDANGDVGSFSDLKKKAYDKDSPWFYCDWGYRSQYNNTAWLKEDEVVDIVNAFLLWNKDHSLITHLGQPDKPTEDTWDEDKVREKLGSSAINSIDSIDVEWDDSGISKKIKINGKSYDAQKFRNLFNLRAPANIQIKPACRPDSSLNCSAMYALYDVEIED